MRTFSLLVVLMMLAFPLFGHVNKEMLIVDKSHLTAEHLAAVEIDAAKAKIDQYGHWVGLGKEVGQAFDGALGAVQSHAQELADSRLGMFIMFLIAYKIIGLDVIQFGVGIPLLITGITLIFWSYRKNCVVRRVKTKGSFFSKDKEWTIANSKNDSDQSNSEKVAHVIVFFLFLGFIAVFLFA